jgi:hypothetical protein
MSSTPVSLGRPVCSEPVNYWLSPAERRLALSSMGQLQLPLNYDEPVMDKVVVLLTDGVNE